MILPRFPRSNEVNVQTKGMLSEVLMTSHGPSQTHLTIPTKDHVISLTVLLELGLSSLCEFLHCWLAIIGPLTGAPLLGL